MEVIIVETSAIASELAADIICHQINDNSRLVLGLATGSTPIEVYQNLIKRCKKGEVSFHAVKTFNLDEYIGIDKHHPQSYRTFMQEKLFNGIDIPAEHTFLPECDVAEEYEKYATKYENKIIEVGGIDLQLLGLGTNGHIGFNEPSSSLRSRTRIKTLTESTLKDNSRFYEAGEYQPNTALTMGIGTISDAKRIVLLAFGEHKANAVANVVEGAVSASCPGSALQFHNKTTVIVDIAAAKNLKRKEYYKRVCSEKMKSNNR